MGAAIAREHKSNFFHGQKPPLLYNTKYNIAQNCRCFNENKINIAGKRKIYQKNIIEEYNIRFDCNVSNGEDILFNIAYLKYVNGILEIPDVLYNYNLNNNSITVRYNAKRFENSKFAYYIRLCMIDEHYMVDYSEIWYYRFWQDINNVWDEKNTWGFSEKIQYCNSILTSTEFRECYDKIDKTSINKIYLNLIEKGNYLWIFFYEKIRNLFK